MRTYSRNVRRAWDGDNYHAPKRQRLDDRILNASNPIPTAVLRNENVIPYDVEDNLERAIRETSVAAMSSSPSRKNSTVFSFHEIHEENDTSTLTPPSSPPPTLDITPPVNKVRKPTFSSLDKRKQKEKMKPAKRKQDDQQNESEVSEPLHEITNSSFRAINQQTPQSDENGNQPTQSDARPPPSLSKALTQTVLDFGQSNTPVTCAQCQMSYTPSVAEDAQLHTMFHSRNSQGIELAKPFMKSAMRWCYEVAHIPGSVVVVDRKISVPARRTVQKVLEVVNKELGSVEISETDLWGQRGLDGEAEDSKKVDRYKVFLHIIDGKCVAVCLAERISKAYKVKAMNEILRSNDVANRERDGGREDGAPLTPTSSTTPPTNLASSADLSLEVESCKAVVGVSRIWTSKNFRRKGIANNLLDCVMNQFIYGMEIDRDEVAFSQPTDMGAALAKGWFGGEEGWTVYKEE